MVDIRKEVVLESIRRFELEERGSIDVSDIELPPCIQNAGVPTEDLLRVIAGGMAQIAASHRIIVSAPWN